MRAAAKALFVLAAALFVVGLILVPLPGPGYLVLATAVSVLVAGIVAVLVAAARR